MIVDMQKIGLGGWKPFQDDPERLEDVREVQRVACTPYLAFFIMLAFSTVIATNGLIADSAATVIGAMIIAPLMQPIGAVAFGLATTDRKMLVRALVTMTCGILCTVALAYMVTLMVGVHTVGREIINRGSPTILDLVVAIAAGATAAFAATRKSIGDAIPGVAIAVALVPPLCVVGIGLALGATAIPRIGLVLRENVAYGAFLLFCANLAGIVFSGAVVYVIQGYGRWNLAARGMVVTVVVIAFLTIPLWLALKDLVLQQQVRIYLMGLRYERPEIYTDIVMRRLDVDIRGDLIYVDIEAVCPHDLESRMNGEIEYVRDFLAQKLQREVEVKTTVILADIIRTRGLSKPAPAT